MKLIALMFALSSVVSLGTGTRWTTVHLPIHVLYVDEGPSGGMTEVPCVTSHIDVFERRIGLMNSVYVPHYARWNIPTDANLITLYGLTVSMTFDMKSDPKNPKRTIVIDCENSVRPKGYPFSVDEVVEKVKAGVKLNLNPETIKVRLKKEKEGEDSADQHATALESKAKAKGKGQPKPESEVRPH